MVWLPSILFSHILGIIVPIDFQIFRGVQTTNQECSIELTPGMIEWSYELMIPVHYRPLSDHDMRGRVREEKNQQPSQDRAVRVQKS